MKRLTSIFTLSLAASLALSACGAKDAVDQAAGTVQNGATGAIDAAGNAASSATDAATKAASATGDAVKDAAGGAVGGVMALKDGVMGMTGAITSTVDAVKTGDFAAAKTSFATVESSWNNLKSVVPADAVGGIQEKITEVGTGLNAASPDKDALLSSLGGLTDLVGGLTQ